MQRKTKGTLTSPAGSVSKLSYDGQECFCNELEVIVDANFELAFGRRSCDCRGVVGRDLDPAGIVDLRALLHEVASRGTAVFIASHMLTEVERICHRVLLVRAGEIIKTLDLKETGPARIRLVVTNERDIEKVSQCGIAAERIPRDSESPTLLLTGAEPIPELVRRLVALGVDIEEVMPEKPSLEKEFLTLFR